ncbi:MAG: hypothetical protein FWC16_09425 [Defluviitaleaceae bacterium]|nr:hypothetical protein [Defluviitaleaceae bacterium]MCL2275132.1 hypothetical protein [Defluviitaleaceae bacterium]
MKRILGISFKELIFAYLAINKVFYWINNINKIQQDEFGTLGWLIFERLLTQDIMTVIILLMMSALDTYIERHPAVKEGTLKHVLVYGIGYVLYIIAIVSYSVLVGAIFDGGVVPALQFAVEMLPFFSMIYIIACIVLSIKEKMKKKEALQYLPDANSPEMRLHMLNELCQCGVISQDEYETKKALCYNENTKAAT